MTIGIYSLWWEQTEKAYIGLSQHCEIRFREHILDMQGNRHSNYKVQNHYNLYGEPTFFILEKCKVEDLNRLEIAWMAEFNSIEDGLNLIEGGQVGWGVNSNASKYSKIQILKVFRLLYSSIKTYEEIATITGVSISTVSDIRSTVSHLWLRDKYPNLHLRMRSNSRLKGVSALSYKARSNPFINTQIISPQGLVFDITNIREFCREHQLNNAHISSTLRGVRKTHKGWHT